MRTEALRVEVVTADALGPGWQRLWQRTPDASPFQSPAWLLPWARIYAADRCRVGAAFAGDELVACLPVFTWDETLLLAGTGPSDEADALVAPEVDDAEGVIAALLSAVLAAAPVKLRQIDFQQLPARSVLRRAAPPPGWREALAAPVEPSPLLALAGADGMANVPARQRADWRYGMRRLAREGGAVERVPEADVPAAMAALDRLHGQRWAARGETGVLADPLLAGLLDAAAEHLAASGLLRLHCVRIGRRTLGVLFALHGPRRTAYYLSGFDPAAARLGPGSLLVGAAIAAAAEEGDAAFDFLRGREPYKYRWGAEDQPMGRRLFVPP